MLSRSVQDYVKAVFELLESGERAGTGALASRLGVAPASVTVMVQRLAAPDVDLLRYSRRTGATLTEGGRREALALVRTHRLIERFLLDHLGYGWDEVHDEAERLEHAVSPAFVDRLDRFLGGPRTDPHGAPIPDREGHVDDRHGLPLTAVDPGTQAVVRRIRRDEGPFLRHLADLGLRPGTRLEVGAQEADGAVQLAVGTSRTAVRLDRDAAGRIEVETLAIADGREPERGHE